MSSVSPLGGWWASVPRERWPTHPDALAEVAEKWQDPGVTADKKSCSSALAFTARQSPQPSSPAPDFTPEAWCDLPDPFSVWRLTAAA